MPANQENQAEKDFLCLLLDKKRISCSLPLAFFTFCHFFVRDREISTAAVRLNPFRRESEASSESQLAKFFLQRSVCGRFSTPDGRFVSSAHKAQFVDA